MERTRRGTTVQARQEDVPPNLRAGKGNQVIQRKSAAGPGPRGGQQASQTSQTSGVGSLGLELEGSNQGVGSLGLGLEGSNRGVGSLGLELEGSNQGVGSLGLGLEGSNRGVGSLGLELEDAAAQQPAAAPGQDNDPFQVARGQLTFDAEGREGGRFHSRTAHWPGGNSGVTIGRGYDLGHHARNQIVTDMTETGIAAGDASRFAAAAGLTGRAAQEWLATNRGSLPEITPEQQEALFERTYAALAGDVERISNNYARTVGQREGRDQAELQIDWNTVHPAIRDVLVDLRYRGDYTPTTRQRVQPPAIANDLRALHAVMRDRDYWMGQRGVPEDRFNRRVGFLDAALGTGGQQDGQAPGQGGRPEQSPAQPEGAQAPASGSPAAFTVTASSLNVRSGPDAGNSNNRIGSLRRGEEVTGTPAGSGWVQISFQGRQAFVSAQFLAPAQAAAQPGPQEGQQQGQPQPQAGTEPAGGTAGEQAGAQAPASGSPAAFTVTASSLNVRSAPDASASNRIGSLRRGAQVTGTPAGSGWVQISFQGQDAFVSAQFLAPAQAGAEPGQEEPAQQPVGGGQRSGAAWVQIANSSGWLNSTDFSALDSSWGPRAQAFVEGLRGAGATVSITAGLRHPNRAFLMHYAWGVAHGQYTPAQANTACQGRGIDIQWDHGNLAASKAAAQALVSAFGLVRQASITSNHIRGLAIDMKISNLPGSITLNGKTYTTQRGASQQAAAASVAPIGRDMGAIWFGSGDWVHWSHNGR